MSAFLYYLPGSPTNDDFKAARGYALVAGIARTQCSRGPDGAAGTIAADPALIDPAQIKFQAAGQIWKKCPLRAGFVGYWKDNPPAEARLRREPLLAGHTVTAGGQDWTIPAARQYEEDADGYLISFSPVPRTLTLDAAGKWTPGDVTPRFRELWQLAGAFLDAEDQAVAEAPPDKKIVSFHFEQLDAFAEAAWTANYRVSPIELDLLGVYDHNSRQAVVDAVLDRDTWARLLKKKLAEQATRPPVRKP